MAQVIAAPPMKIMGGALFMVGRDGTGGGALAFPALFYFFAFARLLFIGQTGQIIHAGLQYKGCFPALRIGIVAFPVFELGMISLFKPCERLHFDLRIPLAVPQLF